MAITQTLLTNGGDATDTDTYTTASISPAGNTLIRAYIANWNSFGTPPAGLPTLTGNSLNWVQISTVVYGPSTQRGRLTIFRGMVASPTSGAVTINTNSSGNNTRCVWTISQYGGVDTSGTDGSGAVVQSATNSSDGTGLPNTLTVTLAALGDAVNNAVDAGFANDDHLSTLTPDAAYTEISQGNAGGEDIVLEANWKLPGTTTPNISDSIAFTDLGGIAIEIKAAGGGGGGGPPQIGKTIYIMP